MTETFLTQERLSRIAAMPPPKRKIAMRIAAQREWDLCASDILYWINPEAHLVPYVYTQDPKAVFVCTICNDGATYHTDKRRLHLSNRHDIVVEKLRDLDAFFNELPTLRAMPMMEYFPPIIDAWLEHPLMVIEKSRDMMISWLAITMMTWDVLFHKGKQYLFQSETASKTQELVKRVEVIYKHQPKWLRCIAPASFALGNNKAGVISVPTLDSEIIGLPKGADAVRQYHPSGIFSDEAAFNPEAGETFAAVKPAIQMGGRYLAVSSANPSFFQFLAQDTVAEVI